MRRWRRRRERLHCGAANIAGGDAQAINYFIAQKYVEALGKFADSPNAKTILMPVEATQLIDSLNDAEDLLLEAGFLLKHTARARMAKIKGLLQRSLVRPEELAMLRGMVRQLRWAIRCHRP